MNLSPPPFKENWNFYFRFIGLGLIVASLIATKSSKVPTLLWIGLLLVAVSFFKRKKLKKKRIDDTNIENEKIKISKKYKIPLIPTRSLKNLAKKKNG